MNHEKVLIIDAYDNIGVIFSKEFLKSRGIKPGDVVDIEDVFKVNSNLSKSKGGKK